MNTTNNGTVSYELTNIEIAGLAVIIPTRAIMILVSIGLLVSCFLLRNKQPLNSRSVLPFLVILTSIGSSIGIIEDSLPETKFIRSAKGLATYLSTMCYLRVLIIYPMFLVTFSSYTLSILRYFLFKAIERRKEVIVAAMRLRNHEVADDLTEFDIDLEMEDELSEFGTTSEMTMNPLSKRASQGSMSKINTTTTSASEMVVNDSTSVMGILSSSSSGSPSTRMLSILEFCVSKKAIACVVALVLVGWYICTLVFLLLYKGNCPAGLSDMTLVVFIFGIVLVIGIPIVALIDLVVNYDLIIKCRLLQYLIHSDPLLFRLEMWLIIIYGTIALIFEFSITTSYAKTREDVENLSRMLSRTFLFDLHLSFIIVPGIALTMSIRNWIIELQQRKFITEKVAEKDEAKVVVDVDLAVYNPSERTIREILKNKVTCDLFREFVKKEFSVENFLFTEDVFRYKKMRKMKPRVKKAKDMVKLYLLSTSKLEVNVPKTHSAKVIASIEEYDNRKISKLPDDLFNELQETVVKNLVDSYSRFYHSSSFQSYLKSKNV